MEDLAFDAVSGELLRKRLASGAPLVAVGGALYTGQNPQSADALAERILADLA